MGLLIVYPGNGAKHGATRFRARQADMKTYDNALPISKLSAWLAAIIFAIFCPALSYSQSIPVSPGQSIQDLVNQKPNGTTFLLKAGVHRMQSVTPKDYDIFQGEPGTILSGARLLTMTPEGKYWIANGQMQEGQRSGACDSAHPRCAYPEDLFIDDRPLVHVSSLSAVVAGKWYFDYAANKVYMADNPAGHRVEIGVSRVAFSGKAVGVGIRGLIIEKYASPAQMGAIGDQYPSTDWTVQDSELRWNHGAGIRLGSRWKALRNKVHHNGQIGIRATSADDVLVEGNEIAYN